MTDSWINISDTSQFREVEIFPSLTGEGIITRTMTANVY